MILQTNNENSMKASLLVSSQVLSVSDDYVVVDIETTGLSPQYDEIIEIAAIKYKFGEKADVFSTLVKPEYKINEYITELTGITNEMVETAPKISDCITDFKEFIGNEKRKKSSARIISS